MIAPPATAPRPRLRPIVMPAEHGGWSFIGAPILLGLLVAPSWIGAMVATAGLLMFLSRQPLKTGAKDLLQKKRYPRTDWALGIGGAELAVALLLLGLSIAYSPRPLLPPIAVFLGVAAIQFVYDSLGKGRNTLPEIVGASAAGIIATIIAIAGGSSIPLAWLLAGILSLHCAVAIVYVGARLDLAHKRPTSILAVWLVALAATAIVAFFVSSSLFSWPLLATFTLLAARAVWGVSRFRKEIKPHFIGIQEIGYTLLLISAVALTIQG